jgi:hypothetical protein
METKSTKKSAEQKPERVTLAIPPEKRAAGVKLPSGNPQVVAREFNAAKLPTNLKTLFEKIEKHGKEGCKLSTLCPKTPEGKYTRWLLRTLVNMGAARAIPEPKVVEKAITKKAPSKKSSTASEQKSNGGAKNQAKTT